MSSLLDSRSLDKHRALVGFELEVLAKKLDRFGWDRDRGTPSHDRVVIDWMDALQEYPLDEVQAACRAVVDSGSTKVPSEGQVKARIIAARRKNIENTPQRKEQPKDPVVTADQADAILKDVGFNVKRAGGAS